MKEYYHLGELLEKIFHHSSSLEQKYIAQSDFSDISANDMHILEAVGNDEAKNMSAVARKVRVTVGTLTIAMNNLVKKGYVERRRGQKDRRVVLVMLTDKGRAAVTYHQSFMYQIGTLFKNELDFEQCKELNRILERLEEHLLHQMERTKEGSADG